MTDIDSCSMVSEHYRFAENMYVFIPTDKTVDVGLVNV
jgi:hypothetical protein